MGLLSFLIIDTVQVSVQDYVLENSRKISLADITVTTKRVVTSEELDILATHSNIERSTKTSEYFTMARAKDHSRLVQAMIFDEAFPLYGTMKITDTQGNAVSWAEASQKMQESRIVAISKEMQYAFSTTALSANEPIKIGEEEFRVGYIIEEDAKPSASFRSFSHKVMIASPQSKADLAQKGNNVSNRYYLKQKAGTDTTQTLQELKTKLEAVAKDATPLSVRSHLENKGSMERIFTFMYHYLGLVSMVTLFLSGIGAFYLFRSFVFNKLQDIAIMQTLGMSQWQTSLQSIFQLLILGLGGTLVSICVYLAFAQVLPMLIGEFLPQDLSIVLSVRSVLFILLIALCTPFVFTLPLLLATRELKPIYLISGFFQFGENKRVYLLGFVPSLVTFYILSLIVSDSWFRASAFVAIFVASLVCIYGVIYLCLFIFARLEKRQMPFTLSLIVKNLRANQSTSSFYFFAVATSVLLISLIPQIEHSINAELAQPKGRTLPSLFLFNIQESKLLSLKQDLQDWGHPLDNASAMVSAEITHKNNTPIKELQKGDGDKSNFRLRRANLTYRDKLGSAETIIKGNPFTGKYDPNGTALVQISLEQEYAKDLGFEIGDTLSFRLISVPFEFTGVVVNHKEIKWNSFQPNFFITIQQGLLEEVPKQLIATVTNVRGEEKTTLQNRLYASYPNVSVIDVVAIIKQVLVLVGKVGIILKTMAVFCFVLGMFILFTIVNHEVRQRQKQIHLFKILGAPFYQIYLSTVGEHLIIGTLAMITGLLPSVALNAVFGEVFFQGAFTFSLSLVLQIFGLFFVSLLLISYAGSAKALRSKPIGLLKSE